MVNGLLDSIHVRKCSGPFLSFGERAVDLPKEMFKEKIKKF